LGKFCKGKSAPDKKNIGKIKKLEIKLKPSKLSISEPTIKPILTKIIAAKKRNIKVPPIEIKLIGILKIAAKQSKIIS
jgi:hypothetical protein